MTTTVRSVRVELDAGVDGYIAKMKLAGRETDKAFDGVEDRISGASLAVSRLEKNTSNLSKTSAETRAQQTALGREVQKSTTAIEKSTSSVEKNARSFDRGGKSIDQYSGRLRLAAELGVTLGTSLIPVGALGIPALAGLATQGGFAAAALGATLLAAQGVGDALKAIEKARISGTAADLQAAREAIHGLAPDARDLVHHLEDLRDVGRGLQFTAANGVLGGVDDALTSLETRIPQVQRILQTISGTVGDDIRKGGDSLASSKYDAFFDFLEHEARPELDATASAVGHLAHGLAGLFTGTVPLQKDFSSFLRSSAESFDEWANRVGKSQEFADFVHYVETEGPKVEATAGAIANAILQIVEAAAPLGGPTLEILKAVADTIAAIADSPIGTPVFGALAAYSAYSRIFPKLEAAYDRATVTQGRFEAGLSKAPALAGRARAGIGVFASDLNKVARYGTLATESTGRLKSQLGGLVKGAAVAGGLALATSGVADSMGLSNTASLALLGTIGGPWGTTIGAGVGLALDFSHANDDIEDSVNRANVALANGDYEGQARELATLTEALQEAHDRANQPLRKQLLDPKTYSDFAKDITGAYGDAAQKAAQLQSEMDATRSAAAVLAPAIGETADELYDGAAAARQFSGALAEFTGWLDKEQALRNYRDGVKDLTKDLKNGFTRKDADDLAAFGTNLAQVASQIKVPVKRDNFLASARATLTQLAQGSGPEAAAALDKVIGKLDQYGLTKPPPKKLDIDDQEFTAKLNSSQANIKQLVGRPYKALITADGSSAILTAHQVQAALNALHDKTVTIRVNHLGSGSVTSSTGGHSVAAPGDAAIPHKADGGTVGAAGRVERAMGRVAPRTTYVHRIPGLADGGTTRRGSAVKPLFTGEGPRFYKAAYKHNKPFALDGPSHLDYPYQTALTQKLEQAMEKWISDWAIPFNPAAKLVDYDMRGFYRKAHPKSWTEGQHFPDTYKTPYDTTFSAESKYATKDNPFKWRGDKLIDTRDGSLIFYSPERRAAADGAMVPKTGLPYADRHLYLLADGEQIITNRRGEADQFRADVASGRIPAYADGGTTGASSSSSTTTKAKKKAPNRGYLDLSDFAPAYVDIISSATSVSSALKTLKNELDKTSASADQAHQDLDALVDQKASLAGSVTDSLAHDPFGGSLQDFNNQTDADANDANTELGALRTLLVNGLDPKGALFQRLAASGNVALIQQFAALSSTDLAAEQTKFSGSQAALTSVGSFVGGHAFDEAIRAQAVVADHLDGSVKDLTHTIHELQQEVAQMGKNVHDGARAGSQAGSAAGSAAGTARGQSARNSQVAASTWTATRPLHRAKGSR